MPTHLNQENYQYPAPKLILLRGVWVVKVSIPAHMRLLFGNGSGTTRDRRKSAKTKDFKIAKSREYELTQMIYDEFDEKLRLQSDQQDQVTSEFAVKTIIGLAQSFKYPDIPDLVPSTELGRLENLKASCDVYSNMVFNGETEAGAFELIELVSSKLKSSYFVGKI